LGRTRASINQSLPKKGRGQKAEGIKYIFVLCHKGLKPLNLFMKKNKKIFFSRYVVREKKVSLLETPKFIYGVSLLPSAFFLLPSHAVYSTRNNWEYEEFVNYCISIAQNNPSYGQYLCSTSLNIAKTFLHSNGNIDVLQEDVINGV
jgi:hypothetical protein